MRIPSVGVGLSDYLLRKVTFQRSFVEIAEQPSSPAGAAYNDMISRKTGMGTLVRRPLSSVGAAESCGSSTPGLAWLRLERTLVSRDRSFSWVTASVSFSSH
jgi:hypothetical protein